MDLIMGAGLAVIQGRGDTLETLIAGGCALNLMYTAMRHPEWAQAVLKLSGNAETAAREPELAEQGMRAIMALMPVEAVTEARNDD